MLEQLVLVESHGDGHGAVPHDIEEHLFPTRIPPLGVCLVVLVQRAHTFRVAEHLRPRRVPVEGMAKDQGRITAVREAVPLLEQQVFRIPPDDVLNEFPHRQRGLGIDIVGCRRPGILPLIHPAPGLRVRLGVRADRRPVILNGRIDHDVLVAPVVDVLKRGGHVVHTGNTGGAGGRRGGQFLP